MPGAKVTQTPMHEDEANPMAILDVRQFRSIRPNLLRPGMHVSLRRC